jgi:hypothetical protein
MKTENKKEKYESNSIVTSKNYFKGINYILI